MAPVGGVLITDIGGKCFLFRLYYKVDIDQADAGGGSKAGSFIIRTFEILEYDSKSIAKGVTSYMHIRFQIHVRVPLKRRKKIVLGVKREIYAKFKASAMISYFLRDERENDPGIFWGFHYGKVIVERIDVDMDLGLEESPLGGMYVKQRPQFGLSISVVSDGVDLRDSTVGTQYGSQNARSTGSVRQANRSYGGVRRRCGYLNGFNVSVNGSMGDLEGNAWRFTSFYGVPIERFRYYSCSLLRQLAYGLNAPWLAVNNFNKIAYSFEKIWSPVQEKDLIEGLEKDYF
ncbi:hypothetical protein Godav_017511 [Gossypium davidsonii]|uniref:Uncharacterized protein n=1 Tax=Gossypium davidsonii TaxID=34287 RepID=A0A7J8QUS5_GOSDV|nr:hypothetical protein [Gossypium davidsonii]